MMTPLAVVARIQAPIELRNGPLTAVALVEALLNQSANGSTLTVVQVGANVGDEWGPAWGMPSSPSAAQADELWHVDVNDAVRVALAHLAMSGRSRALLVEADPETHGVLATNLRQCQRAYPSICRELSTTASAAISASCPVNNSVRFYRTTQRLVSEYPEAPRWARSELSSMSVKTILFGILSFLRSPVAVAERRRRGLPSLVTVSNASDYVEMAQVPCSTPTRLLADATIAAASVDIFAVDAEGMDPSILQGFLQVDGFHPSLIFFEVRVPWELEHRCA